MGDVVIFPRDLPRQLDDISDFLAQNGGAGVTDADAASMMSAEANINGESKRKPIRLANYSPDYNGNWWKGEDGWCGFNVSEAKYIGTAEGLWESLSGKIDGNMNGWVYELPRGVTDEHNEPLRIRDFEGYYPDAKMIPSYTIEKKVSNLMGGKMTAAIPMSFDSNTLALTDFGKEDADGPALNGYYVGVIITKGTNMKAYTANEPISETTQVVVPTEGMAEGEWQAFMFLSKNKIRSERDHGELNTFYTIPHTAINTINISGVMQVAIEVIANRIESNIGVKVDIKITNLTQSAVRFKTNTVQLRFADSDIKDNIRVEEKSQLLQDFTVNAGAYYETSVSFTELDIFLYRNCKVWLTLNSGSIVRDAMPLNV